MGTAHYEALERDITVQEVYSALFEMAPLKALGVDGLHAQFYQSQWNIVGESLVALIKRGFDHGVLEEFVNKTLIVLISKVTRPKLVT